MRYCHSCGYEISENEEFCPECGECVAKRFSVCPKCGDENQIAVKHCRKCGFDLDVPEDVTYCPECDAPVLRTDSFCPSCGAMLSDSSSATYRRPHVVSGSPSPASSSQDDGSFRRDPFVELLLCLLLGLFGMHKFYMGDVGAGRMYFILSVFFSWTIIAPIVVLILCIIDFFRLTGEISRR